MRKFLNHYRLQKKIRWSISSRHSMSAVNLPQQKYRPYFRQNDKNLIKTLMYILLFFSFILGIFGIIFYHSFFRIKLVAITGIERIEEEQLRSTIRAITSTKRFLFLPGDNYFLLNTQEIGSIIRDKFPVESVNSFKEFPGTLKINVQEKISSIIYDTGHEYWYVGVEGKKIEVIRKVTDDEWITPINSASTTPKIHIPPVDKIITEFKQYPIVYDSRTNLNNDTPISSSSTKSIISWSEFLSKKTTIQITYFYLSTNENTAVIYTKDGGELRVLLNDDPMDQLIRLQAALKEKGSEKITGYVDLRFKDRVYWSR